MPKFNKNMSLKGASQEEPQKDFRLGEGLLNGASKELVKMKLFNLRRADIIKNEENHYSINGIESLAWSIKIFGLLQPLHVCDAGAGKYRLLGGERRLTAIDQLIADPEITEWTEETLIPCVVKDPKGIDLPLGDIEKERFSIMTTNKEARKYTDGDKLMELREWKKIIATLRENGVESIPGVSADGEEIEIQIKGEKTRDILTQTTGMGRGTVNQFEKVERLGSEAAIEALLDGKISVGTAEELADNLTQDEQTELLQQAGKEELGEKEIRKAVKRKKEELDPNILSTAVVKADLRDVVKTLGKKEILLNDEARMRYYKCIKELEDFLKEMCDQE